ncbi:BadF/BadG/BcrA/BcrD ATPase family protein [Galbibacter mesophilus]|uniref:BadF/BadG/BcrA/BcrD ATPase family protein n=1 Tax=Galbibacter mesophilus TaxID=379069 RepID=UPI00191E123A|nr:BadF/BadG/BcrA/BcrD ATPase family protein [Galbibacter mesophilus]MCM5661375.1 N-acetylglucosamine kinase [Galbibacter mesophilus]
MILVADSGSTKCDWVISDTNGTQILSTKTEGINPTTLADNTIKNILANCNDLMNYKSLITQIHFYGAGCGTRSADKKMRILLEDLFENTLHISIKEDVVAAIHATTAKPGIICILGTGSNCCFFDGVNVHQRIPSLGYVLSDEGSGNYIGKELLRAYFQKKMPKNLETKFEATFNTDLNEVLQHVYHLQNPNKYLASFARFAFEHRNEPFVKTILENTIETFIDAYLVHYHEELQKHPVHFVGSIAFYGQDIITKQLTAKGYRASTFIKKPIDNLIKYIASQNFQAKN